MAVVSEERRHLSICRRCRQVFSAREGQAGQFCSRACDELPDIIPMPLDEWDAWRQWMNRDASKGQRKVPMATVSDRRLPMERCACGQPLHYWSAETQATVERLIAEAGALVTVTVAGRSWRVPRHYIALHGLKAHDFAALAEQLGFEEVGKGREGEQA